MKNLQQWQPLTENEAATINGGGILHNGLDIHYLLRAVWHSHLVQGVLGTLHCIFK